MLLVCAVFDAKAESYGQPVFVRAKGLAVRSFVDEVNRQDVGNPLYMHPEDYRLDLLSSFDEKEGVFDQYAEVEVLSQGSAVAVR